MGGACLRKACTILARLWCRASDVPVGSNVCAHFAPSDEIVNFLVQLRIRFLEFQHVARRKILRLAPT